MSRVFAPQLPSRFDAASKLWVPMVNLAPAEKYGEVVVMLPPNANRLATVPLVTAMREKMAAFGPQDWLVAVGDPTLIAIAACIAAKRCSGLVRLLKWDRAAGQYITAEFTP